MNRFQMMLAQLDNGQGSSGVTHSLVPVYVAVRLLADLYAADLITYRVTEYVTLKDELVAQLKEISPHWAEKVGQLSLFDRRQMVEIPGLS